MASFNPTQIFDDGTTEEKGENARLSAFVGAIAVARDSNPFFKDNANSDSGVGRPRYDIFLELFEAQQLKKYSEIDTWTKRHGQDPAECVDWRDYGYE